MLDLICNNNDKKKKKKKKKTLKKIMRSPRFEPKIYGFIDHRSIHYAMVADKIKR